MGIDSESAEHDLLRAAYREFNARHIECLFAFTQNIPWAILILPSGKDDEVAGSKDDMGEKFPETRMIARAQKQSSLVDLHLGARSRCDAGHMNGA